MVALTLLALNIMLQTAATIAELKYRKYVLHKWLKGELTMKELLWLKKQPWFQRGFQQVSVGKEKKTD